MNAEDHPCQCGFCVPQLVLTAVDAEVEVEASVKREQPAFERQTRVVIPQCQPPQLVLN